MAPERTCIQILGSVETLQSITNWSDYGTWFSLFIVKIMFLRKPGSSRYMFFFGIVRFSSCVSEETGVNDTEFGI